MPASFSEHSLNCREPEITYKQEITRIEPKEIKTKIYSTDPGRSDLVSDQDIFLFDAGISETAVNIMISLMILYYLKLTISFFIG